MNPDDKTNQPHVVQHGQYNRLPWQRMPVKAVLHAAAPTGESQHATGATQKTKKTKERRTRTTLLVKDTRPPPPSPLQDPQRLAERRLAAILERRTNVPDGAGGAQLLHGCARLALGLPPQQQGLVLRPGKEKSRGR